MRLRHPFVGILMPDAAPTPPASTDASRMTQLVLEVLANLNETVITPAPDPDGDGEIDAGTDPDAGLNLCPAEVPVAYVDITPPGQGSPETTYRFSAVPINKTELADRPWVTRFGKIRRALTNRQGDLRGSTFEIEISDKDRVLRGLEDTDSLVNAAINAYLDTEDNLNSVTPDDPRRVFAGYITDPEPMGGLNFRIRASDIFQALLDRKPKGSQELQRYPTKRFTLADFPNLANDPLDIEYSANGPGNPSLLNTVVPTGYGMLTDEALGADAVGVVSPVFVGRRTFNGFPWDMWVLFGHAVPSVLSVFGSVAGVRAKLPEGMYGVDLVAPGHNGWAAETGSSNPYIDINSNRYSYFLARGPVSDLAREGKVPFTCNLGGVEDVGDGSGAVITSLALQVAHFLTNFVLRDYTSGNWSVPPTINGYSQLKTASFQACKTRSATRLGASPAVGYEGAWVAGWDNRGWTLPEFIRICHDHALDLGINKDGQIIADMVDPEKALNRSISDVTDSLERSFRARRKRDEIATQYVSRYARRYTPALTRETPTEGELLPGTLRVGQTEWLEEPTPVVEDDSKYGTRILTLNLELTRDDDTATDIVAYHNEIRTPGPMIVSFEERLCGTNTDLGSRDELDHFEGVTSSGYTDRSLRCEVHELDLQTMNVTKEYLDLDNVDS